MLPPYYSGAATSPMIAMLRGKEQMEKDADLPNRPQVSDAAFEWHKDVEIDALSMKTLTMWIDLLVPYCGNYLEANAWTRGERAWYEYYTAQRVRNAEIVADDVAKKIEADATGKEFSLADFQQFDAGGFDYREDFVRAWLERKAPSRCAKSGAENVYRNLALNPDDIQGDSETLVEYPHAYANSEYAYLDKTAAKNAIDGNAKTSWSPNLRTDARLTVDFGVEVEIDKVVVKIAVFDTPFFGGELEPVQAQLTFSDGSTETIALKPTTEPQTFSFEKRRVVRASLVNMRGEDGLPKPVSVVEFELWGVTAE